MMALLLKATKAVHIRHGPNILEGTVMEEQQSIKNFSSTGSAFGKTNYESEPC